MFCPKPGAPFFIALVHLPADLNGSTTPTCLLPRAPEANASAARSEIKPAIFLVFVSKKQTHEKKTRHVQDSTISLSKTPWYLDDECIITTHAIYVWYNYLHLVDCCCGKRRRIYHTWASNYTALNVDSWKQTIHEGHMSNVNQNPWLTWTMKYWLVHDGILIISVYPPEGL